MQETKIENKTKQIRLKRKDLELNTTNKRGQCVCLMCR
jgi:hypothetical protein